MLEVPDLGLASWSRFRYGQWSLIYPWSEFLPSILILKVKRTSTPFKSLFEALEDAVGSWLGFGILILIWILSMVFNIPTIQIFALYLDFEGVKSSMSFKSSFRALEDAGGFWLGFEILILIWIWSLVFDIPMIWIGALYLDFEGAMNICVL